jgi:hypothetical protein
MVDRYQSFRRTCFLHLQCNRICGLSILLWTLRSDVDTVGFERDRKVQNGCLNEVGVVVQCFLVLQKMCKSVSSEHGSYLGSKQCSLASVFMEVIG